MMEFVNSFSSLQLDIVGIVAVLGEGSTARNAQASALSWHHVLPRLLPAPQALLRHEQEKRLPTQKGTVVGAYSGNTRFALNFFSQLLHSDRLRKFEVELVEVKKKTDSKDMPAYGVKRYGYLAALSVLGCLMSIVLFALSIHYQDGFALLATVLLSFTSTTVGFASWWKLDFEEEKPKPGREIPDGDLVIYYPRQGAFRVVRCDEIVSRLYFKAELCDTLLGDDWYRIVALVSAVFLLAGLLCLGNSMPIMQMAFAASYILLNVLHWASSALNPLTHHWEHNYEVKLLKVQPPIQQEQSPPPLPSTGIHVAAAAAAVTGNVVASPITSLRPSIEHGSPGEIETEPGAEAPDGVGGSISRAPAPGIGTRERAKIRFETSDNTREKNGPSSSVLARPQQQHPSREDESDIEAKNPPGGGRPYRRLSTISLSMNLGRSALVKTLNRRGRTGTALSSTSMRPEVPQEVANYTAALWTAIALTGSVRWLNSTNIVPDNDVWDKWVVEAGKRATPKWNHHGKLVPSWYLDDEGLVNLPLWDYQGRLGQLFKEADAESKKRPELPGPVQTWLKVDLPPRIRQRLRRLLKNARMRLESRRG